MLSIFTQSTKRRAASSRSSSDGNDGAMRMLVSCGSAVGVSRAGARQGDARRFGTGHDLLRAAFQALEGNEVSAAGTREGADAVALQLFLEDALHQFELGTQDGRMLLHVGLDAVQVLEKAHVAQFVQFIEADGLDRESRLDLVLVLLRGGQGRHAGAGEADLGRGHELVDHVRMARAGALAQDLQNDVLLLGLVIQVMHVVGVVPVDAEILCRGI